MAYACSSWVEFSEVVAHTSLMDWKATRVSGKLLGDNKALPIPTSFRINFS